MCLVERQSSSILHAVVNPRHLLYNYSMRQAYTPRYSLAQRSIFMCSMALDGRAIPCGSSLTLLVFQWAQIMQQCLSRSLFKAPGLIRRIIQHRGRDGAARKAAAIQRNARPLR